MPARIGVVTFPGSLDDRDAQRAVRLAGGEAVALWHADPDLHGVDAVVLPGGFSYGDYLRAGAIARFAPVMRALVDTVRFDNRPSVGTVVHLEKRLEWHDDSIIKALTEGREPTQHGPWSQDEQLKDTPEPD